MRRLGPPLVVMAGASMLLGCTTVNLTIATTAAPKSGATIVQASALSGKHQQVDFLADVNPDCSSPGDPSFDFVSKPGHGRADFKVDTQFAVIPFPAANLRSRCNDRRLDGVAVIYTSEPSFRGIDLFMVDFILPTGQTVKRSYVVTVR